MYRQILFIIIINCILLIPPMSAMADSPAELISQGNTAYVGGKYDEALSAYEEASVEAPESPHIYFNKGTALYQKGDYAGAEKAFEKAALKSKNIRLEASSKFNLGNCAYREAERQQDSDMKKALEACGKSIQHYQGALELDPEFTEAAENIEVVRLVMKNLLDEMNKQKEAQEQQQEAMQKLKEQLKQLIEKQKNVLDRNQKLEEKRSQAGDTPEVDKKIQDLAKDQKDLQKETEALAEDMPKSGGQEAPPAEKHIKNAAKEQQAASGNLTQKNTGAAKNNQEKALKELEDALDSLSDKQQCNNKDQQQKQQQDGSEQKQEQDSSDDDSSQDQEGQEESQQNMSPISDDAHGILDEEKENKKQRMSQPSGGFRDVERDW